MEDLNR